MRHSTFSILRLLALSALLSLSLAATAQGTPQPDGRGMPALNSPQTGGVAVGRAPVSLSVDTTADTVDVNPGDGTCADSNGACSLRAAIMEANASDPGSSISVPAGRYDLKIAPTTEGLNPDASQGDLDLTQTLSITGAGADATVISGTDSSTSTPIDRVFEVSGGAEVTISGLAVVEGVRTNTNTAPGGNILVAGAGSQLTLTGVLVAHGEAGYGGGISVQQGGVLVMSSSALIANHALTSSGGLDVFSGTSSATLTNVTIADNTSAGDVGGVSVLADAALTLNNVTIAANSAADQFGGFSATAPSGVTEDPGRATSSNTLFAGNTANSAADDCAGDTGSTGSLLVQSAVPSCMLEQSDLSGLDPLLSAVTLNAPGTTPTAALAYNSPAVDAGDTATCASADQRGVERPQGEACDIGAFEYDPGDSTELISNGGFETYTSKQPDDWTTAQLSKDKVKCNKDKNDDGDTDDPEDKIFARSGECAYMFRGTGLERARLTQKYDVNLFDTGDTLRASVYYTSKNLTAKVQLRVRVRYIDESLEKGKITLKVPAGTQADYTLLSDELVLSGEPLIVKIQLRMRAKDGRGKAFVDDVSFLHLPTGAAALSVPQALIPLPDAP